MSPGDKAKLEVALLSFEHYIARLITLAAQPANVRVREMKGPREALLDTLAKTDDADGRYR